MLMHVSVFSFASLSLELNSHLSTELALTELVYAARVKYSDCRHFVIMCSVFYNVAPASDQAYEHVLRHHQGNKKTAKHVDDGRHDDRIQARTSAASAAGQPDLVTMSCSLLCCLTLLVACAAAAMKTACFLVSTPLT